MENIIIYFIYCFSLIKSISIISGMASCDLITGIKLLNYQLKYFLISYNYWIIAFLISIFFQIFNNPTITYTTIRHIPCIYELSLNFYTRIDTFNSCYIFYHQIYIYKGMIKLAIRLSTTMSDQNKKSGRSRKALGKHVISLYSTCISCVVTIRHWKESNQCILLIIFLCLLQPRI